MANEQEGPPPRGNDDRVQAWLKNQERDPEAQADSKTLTVMPTRGTRLPPSLDDGAAWGNVACMLLMCHHVPCLKLHALSAESLDHSEGCPALNH